MMTAAAWPGTQPPALLSYLLTPLRLFSAPRLRRRGHVQLAAERKRSGGAQPRPNAFFRRPAGKNKESFRAAGVRVGVHALGPCDAD